MSSYYTGKKFKCPNCKKTVSYSGIRRHSEMADCKQIGDHPLLGKGKHQIAASKLVRRNYGKIELILWEEKMRWTLPEDAIPIVSRPDYGARTSKWEGEGVGLTEKATIELFCANEIDCLKRLLNGFESRTDIKEVMNYLGWSKRGKSWREAFANFSEIYPMERFRNNNLGSGHGNENSQFAVSEKEHARRIKILDSLPDNCGHDGIHGALGSGKRRRTYCWAQGNYPEIDRLVPDIPLSTLATSKNRHALMKAFGERGWTRKTNTDICCSVNCLEKSERWYRCEKHANEYIDAAYKILGEDNGKKAA